MTAQPAATIELVIVTKQCDALLGEVGRKHVAEQAALRGQQRRHASSSAHLEQGQR